MSGAGKSTLAEYARVELKRLRFSTLVIDGDVIRTKYDIKLGYGRDDVEKNNLYITKLCEDERYNYDVILVPIISPIDVVRRNVRKILSPDYNLIYISADIESLKLRDPKGLYKKADNGEINGLIGYSDSNTYDVPIDYDMIICTSRQFDVVESKQLFVKFIMKIIYESTFSLRRMGGDSE